LKLKHLDLFSGIGGFSLGLEATNGFETVAFCDIEEFPRKVLQKHWSHVKQYTDIKELNYEQLKADGLVPIDIITGGYPCQPFSVAGRKKGEKDPRHLWPEYFRLVKELRPTWVIGENVGGHIKLGLDTVLENLESEGYAVRTFSIPASAIGANHKRERVWIVAYSERNHNLREKQRVNGKEEEVQREHWEDNSATRQSSGTNSIRQSNNTDVEDTRRTLRQRTFIRGENENEIGQGNADLTQRSSETSEFDVADTDINGLKRGLSEVSNKADARKDTPQLGRKSSGETVGQGNDGRDRKESRTDEDISGSSNAGEGEFATTRGVRELSSQSSDNKRISREDNNQENNDRALVQERQGRVQSSERGELGHNQAFFEGNKIQQGNDNINEQGMDNVANTESEGLQGRGVNSTVTGEKTESSDSRPVSQMWPTPRAALGMSMRLTRTWRN
jgi:DNA-cytosine methyltransferase